MHRCHKCRKFTKCMAVSFTGNAQSSYFRRLCIKCFAVVIAGYAYKMFCCHNRRICTQNVLLSQSQDVYTTCFAVTIAGYVFKTLCLHNLRKCRQNVFAFTIAGNAYKMFLLAYSQAIYTQCFAGIVAGYV